MKRSIIAEVEAEFGEPFWDVVKGFAADGYSCNTTARILGYGNPIGLRRLIKRHEVVIAWPKHGSCVVQMNRSPLREETRKRISASKRDKPASIAQQYQQRTGEHPVAAIKRMAATMCVTDVARAIGWGSAHAMRHWLKIRGVKVQFAKARIKPPENGRAAIRKALNGVFSGLASA